MVCFPPGGRCAAASRRWQYSPCMTASLPSRRPPRLRCLPGRRARRWPERQRDQPNHQPSQALSPTPRSAAAEVKAQKALSAASAVSVRLPRAWPVRCLARASDGVTSRAAAATASPGNRLSGAGLGRRSRMLSAVRWAARTKERDADQPDRAGLAVLPSSAELPDHHGGGGETDDRVRPTRPEGRRPGRPGRWPAAARRSRRGCPWPARTRRPGRRRAGGTMSASSALRAGTRSPRAAHAPARKIPACHGAAAAPIAADSTAVVVYPPTATRRRRPGSSASAPPASRASPAPHRRCPRSVPAPTPEHADEVSSTAAAR